MALTGGIASLRFAIEVLRSPSGTIEGLPATPGFVFGAVALLAALGDTRMMLAGGIQGAHRIARHLWRMCFALFIAAGSFFLVEAEGGVPRPIRNLTLLSIPVLLVLVVMFFWLARVLFTERYRRA